MMKNVDLTEYFGGNSLHVQTLRVQLKHSVNVFMRTRRNSSTSAETNMERMTLLTTCS